MQVKRQIVTGLQLMMNPQAFVPFLVGAIALAVLGNAVFELLLSALGRGTWTVTWITVVSFLVFAGAALWFGRAVLRARPNEPLAGKRRPQPRKGLIVLVSNEGSLNKALEYHASSLQYCWLLCTAMSAPRAEETRDRLKQEGKEAKQIFVTDVYDPLEVRDKVADIYRTLPDGLRENEVILDFTGMTAVASVGSVLACLNTERPIEYVPAETDKDGKAIGSKDPIEITLD